MCQGEGPRYGDFKCNHDSTHRVCAHLVDNSGGKCKELSWGKGTFWEITHQQDWNWKESVCNAVSSLCAALPPNMRALSAILELTPLCRSASHTLLKPNPGNGWCICMWAFARMIERVSPA